MLQLVVPAYNEQDRLPRTLRELRRFVRAHRGTLGEVEVVVVDNASTDRTADVAREADSVALPVRVVTCRVRGKGAAVAAGVAATDADVVGFLDADGATDNTALLEGLRRLALGAHVAVGSRAADGSHAQARHSALRENGARRYRELTARIVPGVADTQCGFKLFDGDLARAVFAELRTTGFSFDVEVLARCQIAGASVVEFPVQWVDVPGSTFEPLRHGPASFWALATISRRLRPLRVAAAGLAAASAVPALHAHERPAGAPSLALVGGTAVEA
ncbi:MAG: glycosyl transferase family 2 [Nocardioides sp.]|nr:glycosyl transferase family 2 [Nocardioides sp.]